jgi:putative ABC transport system permease protein
MASNAEPIGAMRGANRAVGLNHGVVGSAAQKVLVIVQAAVSLVLLSAAAMLGKSLRNLEHQNFGFDAGGRYVVTILPKLSGYRQEQLLPLLGEIENQLRHIPGVLRVGSVLAAPQQSWVWPHDIRVEGKPEPGEQDDVSSGWTRVTPGFFEALGDRIVVGRPITDADNASTRPVAVINQAFAERFFGRENPIGQHFAPAPGNNSGMYEIIGVVADVRFGNDLHRPMYFLPEAQSTLLPDAEGEAREVLSHYLSNVVLWAPGNPQDLDAQVRKALAKAAPNLVVNSTQPFWEIIQSGFAQQNMIASLTWLFGILGLVLAAVGLYGVTAYGVEQRTNEIGVRMALGADRGSVVLIVLRAAFFQVAIGLALGIPGAIGAGYLISSHLFGVRPWDPLMLSLGTVLLAVAALIAAAIPARRATLVDPMVALRYE